MSLVKRSQRLTNLLIPDIIKKIARLPRSFDKVVGGMSFFLLLRNGVRHPHSFYQKIRSYQIKLFIHKPLIVGEKEKKNVKNYYCKKTSKGK